MRNKAAQVGAPTPARGPKPLAVKGVSARHRSWFLMAQPPCNLNAPPIKLGAQIALAN
jgi:hypothetical protein